MIITFQSHNTITIPPELGHRLKLQPGDPLEARVEDGNLVLTPVADAPRQLRLTESGEAKEAEADADLAEGRIARFESPEALLRDLGT